MTDLSRSDLPSSTIDQGGEVGKENGNICVTRRSQLTESIGVVFKETTLNANEQDIDDDDPFTAPFEILAEFLSALMSRDYKGALHYCKLILQYEPDNVTVQEFHPLIEEKIRLEKEMSTSEGSESSEMTSSTGETEGSTDYSSATSEDEEEDDDNDENLPKEKVSR